MMKITIVCVGKLKEKYLIAGIQEYAKRLDRYCRLQIIEVADEMTPDGASDAVNRQIKQIEGMRLSKHIQDNAYVIALDPNGEMPDSIEFSRKLEQLTVRGNSHIVMLIGGSLGLSDEMLARANEKLSFSRLTFPHQLMRLILLEQIYRAFRIWNHEPYHK